MRASSDEAVSESAVRRRPPLRHLHSLHPPQQIRAMLLRERSRADRSGRELSLVVFEVLCSDHRSQWRLARTLLGRARLTDEVGWFDAERLCAVLPDTAAPGARCFAQSVCDLAMRRSVYARSHVYTYPSQWLAARNLDAILNRPRNASPGR